MLKRLHAVPDKRERKDATRPHGRLLAKIAAGGPHMVLETMVQQVRHLLPETDEGSSIRATGTIRVQLPRASCPWCWRGWCSRGAPRNLRKLEGLVEHGMGSRIRPMCTL